LVRSSCGAGRHRHPAHQGGGQAAPRRPRQMGPARQQGLAQTRVQAIRRGRRPARQARHQPT
jgi:hypothetical protein